MKKLPKIQLVQLSEKEKGHLDKWLELWSQKQTEYTVAENEYIPDETISSEQMAELKKQVNPFDTNIQCGEIRLLSDAIIPAVERPYYAAVLDKGEGASMLIAPYAPLPEPATPGELNTQREHFSLANLELWNACYVPAALLKKSWLVDQLSPEENKDALAVYSNSSDGTQLPDALELRVGVPIVHPDDPRYLYLDEEAQLLVPLKEKIRLYEQFLIDPGENLKAIASFAEENIEFADAAAEKSIDESKCVFTDKSLSDFLKNELKDQKGLKGGLAIARGFEALNPQYQDVKLLQWVLQHDMEIDGTELVFAFDRVSGTPIGTGSVCLGEREHFINIDRILYPFISRTIDKETDIVLVVIKG